MIANPENIKHMHIRLCKIRIVIRSIIENIFCIRIVFMIASTCGKCIGKVKI
jgi:hypothetical protein